MEYDEAAMMKMIEESDLRSKQTMEKIKPVFDKMVNLSIPSDFYSNEYEVVLSYDIPEKPFYGSYFMGTYNKDTNYIDIEIKSENAFNQFFEIFPSAPKIDFEHLNHVVNEFRLMYAFILGEDVVCSVNSIEDVKDHFYWCGDNYRFSVRLFDEHIHDDKHFVINLFYGLCTETCQVIQTYKYEFKHPKIGFSCERWDSIDEIKTEFFKYVAKMLNKPVNEIAFMDYKLLPMLNV